MIIATMNRAKQLESLTLSSLCRQDTDQFDIIVWDASSSDDTLIVCNKCLKKINSFSAPRRGLTKQRNDAVKNALELFSKNEVIAFFDDDVVLSENAISGIIKTFEQHSEISGVGVPIIGETHRNNILKKLIKSLFLNLHFKSRHMTRYAYGYQVDIEQNNTPVNWLSGCSMAYRRECFEIAQFDERLCRFGGYCLAEDSIFSSKLNRNGKKLMLSIEGSLVHMRDGNARLDYRKMVASFIFNKNILFHTLNDGSPKWLIAFWRCAFIWNQLYNLSSLFFRSIHDDQVNAYWLGILDGLSARRKGQDQ